MIELSEAEVKKGIEDYLTYAFNQGKLWYARLNAGTFVTDKGTPKERAIKGVGKGTADFIVIQSGNVQMFYLGQPKGKAHPVVFVTFIECKKTNWKPSKKPNDTEKNQLEFEEVITKLNCQYVIVRSVDELIEALERE